MIQTTHGKAVSAFMALNQIRGIVKGMDALHVFHMKNVLKEAVDFMTEEEMRLVQEAGGTVTENGMVLIADPARKAEYLRARRDLDAMPFETDAEPIVIRIDRCPEVTGEQIELLDGFVVFEEDDRDGNE